MYTTSSFSLGLVLALGQLAATQNSSTTTLTGNCSSNAAHDNGTYSYDDYSRINTTGTTSFTLQQLTGNDQPWYYYLTLEEGVMPNNRSGGFIQRWLGVPESFLGTAKASETRVCMYTMSGQDKELTNKNGNQTCEGILSDKCVNSVVAPPATGLDSGSGCPSFNPDKDCKSSGGYFSAGGQTLSKASTCFRTSLPGVDVPEGYIILGFAGVGYGGDGPKADLKAYDKVLHQSIPSFFRFIQTTVQPGGNSTLTHVPATQAVCGIPNKVRQGSRPVDSLGGKLELSMLTTSVVAMSLLFCFM